MVVRGDGPPSPCTTRPPSTGRRTDLPFGMMVPSVRWLILTRVDPFAAPGARQLRDHTAIDQQGPTISYAPSRSKYRVASAASVATVCLTDLCIHRDIPLYIGMQPQVLVVLV